ncbi:MAG: phosphatase PAP2 family protein [Saprospiraceae bacterium]|nr:phosphatase PAP2 family protein [Saprospiraceae bacterium]MCB9356159.1 phosphatase PAP2 family protein [Lewinellaceae bacterium]
MKNIWENPWFTIPVLVFFNAGLLLAFFVPYGDEILYLNGLRHEPFNTAFRLITKLGEVYAFLIAGVALLFWRFRFALLIAITGLIILPTTYIFKEHFSADRPITFFQEKGMRQSVVTVPGVDLNTGQTSFPSGHTTAAFGLYSILALIAGSRRLRWGIVFAGLAILVAVSRVFLVQHFLADIMAGATLGLLIGSLVWRLNEMPFFRQSGMLDKRIAIGAVERKTVVRE